MYFKRVLLRFLRHFGNLISESLYVAAKRFLLQALVTPAVLPMTMMCNILTFPSLAIQQSLPSTPCP